MGESFVTPIEVIAITFGGVGEVGIVQRTFRIALVVMFGGSIVNPFVTLKEDISGVAPTIALRSCQRSNTSEIVLWAIDLPTVNTT